MENLNIQKLSVLLKSWSLKSSYYLPRHQDYVDFHSEALDVTEM